MTTDILPSPTSGPGRGAAREEIAKRTRSFTDLAQNVRALGLNNRTRWFYWLVFGGLVLALGGAFTGIALLRDSWFQLLIAAALGIIFTQFAFLGHEASHRQVLNSGPANDHVGRVPGRVLRRHELLVVDEQAQPAPRQPEQGRQGSRHRARQHLLHLEERRGAEGILAPG